VWIDRLAVDWLTDDDQNDVAERELVWYRHGIYADA
jgi:hypothetical protein